MKLFKSGDPEEFLMFLSKEELAYLIALSGQVGGPKDTGIRPLLSSIYHEGAQKLGVNSVTRDEIVDTVFPDGDTINTTGADFHFSREKKDA